MAKRPPSPTFIRQWREFRQLSLERLADRLGTTKASLSRIERGLQPYSQPILEALAEALLCEPADLLMRNPVDPDGIWSIWDNIPENDRPRAVAVLRAMLIDKTGSGG
jgi:transcriptional regulator with XRE-family HTH domain